MQEVTIDILMGKTLDAVVVDEEPVLFRTTEGEVYEIAHAQDCYEAVYLEDCCGDTRDLVGAPIIEASCVSSGDRTDLPDTEQATLALKYPHQSPEAVAESYTWTFYKIGTRKGFVTLRWFGTSNGYYSEEVTLYLRE